MRHDPIDPARCSDPESPAAYECESLEEIAAARARLRNGTFGTCEACGTVIPLSRLEAIPTAHQCLPCQAKAGQRRAKGAMIPAV